MSARILYGYKIKERIIKNIKANSIEMIKKNKPHLGILQCNNLKSSNTYISKKIEVAKLLGFEYEHVNMGNDATENEILNRIDHLNSDSKIDGIILQLPIVSSHEINVYKCLNSIITSKDVEGLNINNLNSFENGDHVKNIVPCTAASVFSFIWVSGWNVKDLKVYLAGEGLTTGRPIKAFLTYLGADVYSEINLNDRNKLKDADLIISCIGKPFKIVPSDIQDGAAIIDFGAPKNIYGYNGDINTKDLEHKLSWYTPVPGGVGPVTTGWLFQNLFELYNRSLGNPTRSFYQQFEEIMMPQ